MLAQKLALETNEHAAIKVANKFGAPGGALFGGEWGVALMSTPRDAGRSWLRHMWELGQ